MRMEKFESLLEESKIIAILRGVTGSNVDRMVSALYEGGIRLAEITLNTDGALASISHLREIWHGKMMIGAGTVTCRREAEEAIAAGAELIVTPNVEPEAIRFCCDRDIPITPGALTPTEIITAKSCGSEYVKLFPAGCMGTGYVRQLLGPLKGMKLLAVGGINEENAGVFLQSGVCGLGVGGGLCSVPEDGDFGRITQSAQRLLQVCGKCG